MRTAGFKDCLFFEKVYMCEKDKCEEFACEKCVLKIAAKYFYMASENKKHEYEKTQILEEHKHGII